MTPKAFDYVMPTTLDEAISILDTVHPENGVKILAGGQSLVPLMKLRLASPDMLIDINGIEGLSYIKSNEEGSTVIGALTRYNRVQSSDLIKENFPILVEAIASIADTQIRNRGTIGGNVCHADPASDLAPALLALKANFKVVGPGGKTRLIPSDEFFLDVFTPNLEPNEILQEVSIPKTPSRSSGTYLKFTEVSGGYAIVGVAVQVALDPKAGIIHEVGIGLTAMSSTPVRAKEAEETLQRYGDRPSEELIEEASLKASEVVNSLSGVEGIYSIQETTCAGFVQKSDFKISKRIGCLHLKVRTRVNGVLYEKDVEPRLLLIHFLRETLALTGSKIGCEIGKCGACTVVFDGEAIKSCMMFTVQANNREITTVEGISHGNEFHPIQNAFWEKHGLQCGYCTPGMIMSTYVLLTNNHNPTDGEIKTALSGNMCTCTGYTNILKAVRLASTTMQQSR